MMSIPIPLQSPFFLIIFGMVLCLVFEAAGVPEGFRRHGSRNYISLIAALVVLTVFFLIQRADSAMIYQQGGMIFDRISRGAILSLSLLVLTLLWIIVERLKPLNMDRGEVYALVLFSYFSCIVISCANDLPLIATSIIAWPLAQIGILAIRKKRRASPEVALKLIVGIAFTLIFLAMVFVFSNLSQVPFAIARDVSPGTASVMPSHLAATILLISLLLFLMGCVPLQSIHVDILDGAPSYVSAFVSGATFIVSSALLIRLVESLALTEYLAENAFWMLVVFASLSLCLGPVMALDQRRISRILAYLISSQAGLVLFCSSLSLHHTLVPDYFYGLLFTHFSLCAAGTYAGINFWKDAKHSFKSWEDFAGAGRKHPVAAGAFFFVLASICGLPFTSGFVLRNLLIELTPTQYRFPIIAILLASIVLCAVPVFRLFAFFFGKMTRHELRKHHQPRQIVLLLFCALSLFLISIAPETILWTVFG